MSTKAHLPKMGSAAGGARTGIVSPNIAIATGRKARVKGESLTPALSGFAIRDDKGKHVGSYAFVDIFRAEPLTRVGIIKKGLPAHSVDDLATQMSMPKERLLPALGIAPATVSRKARAQKPLSSDDSERVLGLARLVGQVAAMVEESGDPANFNAAEWVAQWLEEPLAALGGLRPAELMDTSEGQAMVANLLARTQSGAYA